MLNLTVLFNKSNPFGIAKDVEGIAAALGSKCNIRYADPLEAPHVSDVAIHLEIPSYVWMPWARENILMVNPEWFKDAWIPYMSRFKYVIYKDSVSAAAAVAAGHVTAEQVRVVPWGMAAPPVSSEKKGGVNTGFVWFLGRSVNKRAYVPKLVSLWRPEYPPLRIYAVEPLDLSGALPENVRLEIQDLDAPTRLGLANFFRGHVCCSAAEGFGYTAAEAEWNGAFTLLNELSCYREDYGKERGVAFVDTQESLDAAIRAFESTEFSSLEIVRKTRAAERYKQFLKLMADVVVAEPATLAPLPPILQRDDCPPISIVTLMYNRRKFFDLACHNILSSDYPKSKIEWIIVEDSDDPMEGASDLITAVAEKADAIRIVYIPLAKKTSVAAKRNIGTKRATADIILMMDDDDHYPETSFRRRVAWLTKHPWGPKAVGATTIACYDLVKGISAVNVPPAELPLGQRISEATLTFYKSWWEAKGFPAATQVGEGEEFLAGREGEVLEIPPQQIIVAFSHGKNVSSRRIPSGADVTPGCFWGFPREFLVFVHGLAGVKVVEEA
jgi:Glycosyl transferase family 2